MCLQKTDVSSHKHVMRHAPLIRHLEDTNPLVAINNWTSWFHDLSSLLCSAPTWRDTDGLTFKCCPAIWSVGVARVFKPSAYLTCARQLRKKPGCFVFPNEIFASYEKLYVSQSLVTSASLLVLAQSCNMPTTLKTTASWILSSLLLPERKKDLCAFLQCPY